MQELADTIKTDLLKEIKDIDKEQDLVELKAKYIGKSGRITFG